jgi:hypothetical protein
LTGAFRRTIPLLVCGVLPVAVLALMFQTGLAANSLAVDFHYELYPQAKELLAGGNPYPGADFEPMVGGNLVWPPLAAAVVAPLTLLRLGVADVIVAALGLLCFAAALRLVGVRDWRVYGACCLWPSVAGEMRVAHLTPLLALLTAQAWRDRDRRIRAGAPLGLAIGVKFFVWPLALWLAAIRRPGATALAIVIAGASALLVLPYTGLVDYFGALRALGSYFDQDSYTIFGLLVQLGVGDVVAHAITSAVGCALLIGTWRFRSYSLAIAAALVLSPIVWLDYFALAALPLAIARPRVSAIWFLPVATWGVAGTGLAIGDAVDIVRVLSVFGVVLAIAFRTEQSARRRDVRASTPHPLSHTRVAMDER